MTTDPLPFNFAGLTGTYAGYDQARVVILPVPYEGTATYKKGAAAGPDAILDASRNMELFDEVLRSETFRIGIHTREELTPGGSSEETAGLIAKQVTEFLKDDKFVVTLGGEHSITLGPVQACAQARSGLSILHFDAHTDLRDSYEGNRFGHGCVMRRCMPFGPITQVGIRSLSTEEATLLAEAPTVTTFYAHELRDLPSHIDEIVSTLTEEVYVTIDLDVLDPAFMPATGTPEPGGLDWYELTAVLERVAHEKDVVGFDVVELLPTPGMHASDFLAAKLIYRFLGYLTAAKGWPLR